MLGAFAAASTEHAAAKEDGNKEWHVLHLRDLTEGVDIPPVTVMSDGRVDEGISGGWHLPASSEVSSLDRILKLSALLRKAQTRRASGKAKRAAVFGLAALTIFLHHWLYAGGAR